MISGPLIVKNFLNSKEVEDLNNWTTSNYPSPFFEDAFMGIAGTQYTTRYWGKYGEDQSLMVYPDIAYDIQNRIIDHFQFKDIKYPPFKDGISNYIYFENASIMTHVDGRWHRGYYTVHCNVITQKSEVGGLTKIKQDSWLDWDVEPGDMLCYPVTELRHYVTKCMGNTPRIMWSWAYCMPLEK